ncbi:MAG: cytochrome P460 family protein [Thermodesulfobacteriota bacterium]
MKNFWMKILLTVTVGSLMTIGIGTTSALGGGLPAADAGQLWEHMTKANPYTGWGYFPGREGLYKGTHPHGAHLKLFANGPALKALREGKAMPYGSIVLKENYGKDGKTLMALTPMYKVKGFNPGDGDWFWAKYGADGKVMKAGKVKGCIDCHKARENNDWIFNEAK